MLLTQLKNRLSGAEAFGRTALAFPGNYLELGVSRGLKLVRVPKKKAEVIGTWTTLLLGMTGFALGIATALCGVIVTPAVVSGSVALAPCLALYAAGAAIFTFGTGLMMAAFGTGRKEEMQVKPVPPASAAPLKTAPLQDDFKKTAEPPKVEVAEAPAAPAEAPKP